MPSSICTKNAIWPPGGQLELTDLQEATKNNNDGNSTDKMIQLSCHSNKQSSTPTSSSACRTKSVVSLICLCILVAFLFLIFSSEENTNLLTEDNNNNNANVINVACEKVCNTKQERIQHFQGKDLLNSKHILELAQQGKDQYLTQLKHDYGDETYMKMFFEKDQTTSRGRTAFRSANNERAHADQSKSWDRMKRKFILKLLMVQYNILQQEKGSEQCSCGSSGTTSSSMNNRYLQQRKHSYIHSHHSHNVDAQKLRHQQLHSRYSHRRVLDNSTTTSSNTNNDDDDNDKYKYVRYVYANGGQSTSAGHGNLYRESYTAVLERALQPIFAMLGIDFEARQYGMGGTKSGSAMALCIDSVFGNDLDTITWDYGMTDADNFWMHLLYMYHAAKQQEQYYHAVANFQDNTAAFHQQRTNYGMPTTLTLNCWGGLFQRRKENIAHLEGKAGMSSMYLYESTYNEITNALPDTFGLSDEQIQAMPEHVRAFRCENSFEKGKPYCEDWKFNDTLCPRRRFKFGWHPGWKVHALQGNLITLLFIEVLMDAVQELDKLMTETTTTTTQIGNENSIQMKRIMELYERFHQQDVEDHNQFLESRPAMDIARDMILPPPRKVKRPEDDPNELARIENTYLHNMLNQQQKEELITNVYKTHSYCRNAVLPSDARYRGLFQPTTTSSTSSTPAATTTSTLLSSMMGRTKQQAIGFDRNKMYYDVGITRKDADDNHSGNTTISEMRLVYDADAKERQTEYCPEIALTVDYKDYYYIHHEDGWAQLTLPNELERAYYNYNTNAGDSKGRILMICPMICDWDQCPHGEVGPKGLAQNNGQVDMEINGIRVAQVSKFGECFLLFRKDITALDAINSLSYYWHPSTTDGTFQFKIRVNYEKSYLRLSQFIIF